MFFFYECIFIPGFKVKVDEASADDDEDLEDAFGVLRFGEIFRFCSSSSEERMGRIYTERDYDCKRQRTPAVELTSHNTIAETHFFWF